MSGFEIIGLVDACIGIAGAIIEIGQAAKNAHGLPKEIQTFFERFPAIKGLLEQASGRLRNDTARADLRPVFEQCKKSLTDLEKLFDKICPKEGSNSSQRVWKATVSKIRGRDTELQRLWHQVEDNLKILEQKQILDLGDTLGQFQEVINTLAEEEHAKYSHSGSGHIFAHHGDQKFESGSNNRFMLGAHIDTYNESTYVQASPPTSVERPWFVPRSADANFYGYEDFMQRLHTRFLGPKKDQITFVIRGMAGVGKSELILQFLAKCKEAIRDSYYATFWVDCSTTQSIDSDFTRIAEWSGWSQNTKTQDVVARLATSERRTLLVLDNCDHIKTDYGKLIPHGSGADVVMTSRLISAKTYATISGIDSSRDAVHLIGLDDDAALNLFVERCDIVNMVLDTKDQAKTIALMLENHPLALRVAGSLIRMKLSSLDRFEQDFKSNFDFQEAFLDESTTPNRKMQAVLDISAASLEASDYFVFKDALALLDVLAFLDHRSVPVSFFLQAWSYGDTILLRPHADQQNPFKLQEWHVRLSRSWLSESAQRHRVIGLRRAIDRLSELSIVSLDADANTDTDTVSMHSLIHMWARYRIKHKDTASLQTANLLGLLAEQTHCEHLLQREFEIQPHVEAVLSSVEWCSNVDPNPVGQYTITYCLARMLVYTGSMFSAKCSEALLQQGKRLLDSSPNQGHVSLAYELLAHAYELSGVTGVSNVRDQRFKFQPEGTGHAFFWWEIVQLTTATMRRRESAEYRSQFSFNRLESVTSSFLDGLEMGVGETVDLEQQVMEYHQRGHQGKISILIRRVNEMNRSEKITSGKRLNICRILALALLKVGRLEDAEAMLEGSFSGQTPPLGDRPGIRGAGKDDQSDTAQLEQEQEQFEYSKEALAIIYSEQSKRATGDSKNDCLRKALGLLARTIDMQRHLPDEKKRLHGLSYLSGVLLFNGCCESAGKAFNKLFLLTKRGVTWRGDFGLWARGESLLHLHKSSLNSDSCDVKLDEGALQDPGVARAIDRVRFLERHMDRSLTSELDIISHEVGPYSNEQPPSDHRSIASLAKLKRAAMWSPEQALAEEVASLMEIVDSL